MRLALALVFLAACGSSSGSGGGGGGGSGGGSAGGGAASGGGAGGGGQASCNTVADDSTTYFPGCPGTGNCPGCDLLPGDGGTIADGTYRAAQDILWESACGAISMVPSHATLVIADGGFELVSTGPRSLSPHQRHGAHQRHLHHRRRDDSDHPDVWAK
ncbi:MAG: hypothetical protein QM723_00340 [Myxococcaceae bacterium]